MLCHSSCYRLLYTLVHFLWVLCTNNLTWKWSYCYNSRLASGLRPLIESGVLRGMKRLVANYFFAVWCHFFNNYFMDSNIFSWICGHWTEEDLSNGVHTVERRENWTNLKEAPRKGKGRKGRRKENFWKDSVFLPVCVCVFSPSRERTEKETKTVSKQLCTGTLLHEDVGQSAQVIVAMADGIDYYIMW